MTEITKVKNIEQILDTLTPPEVNELITNIKKNYNLQEEIVVAPSSAKAQEEVKNVSLLLKKVGPQSLQIYKLVGSKLGKSLLEAKKLLESLPVTILNNVPKEEAQELETQLKDQGAEVEIK